MSAATMSQEKAEGMARLRSVREGIAQRLDRAAEAWREMPLRVRVTLLMVALEPTAEDPRDVARRPWRSFSEAERESLGSVARVLQAGLSDAGWLR